MSKSNRDSRITIHAVAFMAVAGVLAGCGVDTATTAATGAAIKRQEADQGKKTLEQMQQKTEQAAQQLQQRAEQANAAADK
ncbi:MAG: hypothetical protein HYY78_20065 [Betaproteobacteria bacterium]|nr:hypothetical protein [Betaproteobacteria bacterium]